MQSANFEIRLDEKGEFDELVVYDATGRCIVHLEMMSAKHLWGGIYPHADPKAHRVVFNVMAKKRLNVTAGDD